MDSFEVGERVFDGVESLANIHLKPYTYGKLVVFHDTLSHVGEELFQLGTGTKMHQLVIDMVPVMVFIPTKDAKRILGERGWVAPAVHAGLFKNVRDHIPKMRDTETDRLIRLLTCIFERNEKSLCKDDTIHAKELFQTLRAVLDRKKEKDAAIQEAMRLIGTNLNGFSRCAEVSFAYVLELAGMISEDKYESPEVARAMTKYFTCTTRPETLFARLCDCALAFGSDSARMHFEQRFETFLDDHDELICFARAFKTSLNAGMRFVRECAKRGITGHVIERVKTICRYYETMYGTSTSPSFPEEGSEFVRTWERFPLHEKKRWTPERMGFLNDYLVLEEKGITHFRACKLPKTSFVRCFWDAMVPLWKANREDFHAFFRIYYEIDATMCRLCQEEEAHVRNLDIDILYSLSCL